MDFNTDLKSLEGNLSEAIIQLGRGGDGNVWLHELEKDGVSIKVTVKSVTQEDPKWEK